MIAEAIVQKDGLFIKGYKPSSKGARIVVHVEEIGKKTHESCRGLLARYRNPSLIEHEKNGWRLKQCQKLSFFLELHYTKPGAIHGIA
jgi:hypothetical protein